MGVQIKSRQNRGKQAKKTFGFGKLKMEGFFSLRGSKFCSIFPSGSDIIDFPSGSDFEADF